MKKTFFKVYFLLILAGLFSHQLSAQPFIDILNFNSQNYQTKYKDSAQSKNKTSDYNLTACIPKKFNNGNTFLLRLSGEKMISSIGNSSTSLYAFSIPVGFQFVSKNKKWKTLALAIPKISSDLKDNLSKDVQYGGTILFTYVKNDSLLKFKFGLYYNREYFGNFFVPLIGIDWKVTEHISVYGILPNNMRVEYGINRRFYFGIAYKNYQRSYRLSNEFNNDFVRVRESQLKLFADLFVWKKILLFADAGYMLKYDFAQYDFADKKLLKLNNPVYTPMKNNFMFTIGLAYRLRLD